MGMIKKGRWPTTKRDEFGSIGFTVTTRCAFCEKSHYGLRDDGRVWFEKHMKKHHQEILTLQANTPSKRKRPRGCYRR